MGWGQIDFISKSTILVCSPVHDRCRLALEAVGGGRPVAPKSYGTGYWLFYTIQPAFMEPPGPASSHSTGGLPYYTVPHQRLWNTFSFRW